MSQCFVYSLSLADSNFCIKETMQFTQRMISHFSGKGSLWTKKHYPVAINYIQACVDREAALIEEEKLTLRMAKHYGWKHVRGSNLCQIILDPYPPTV